MMGFTRIDLDQQLAYATSIGGSDVHLKVGSPPCVRIDGRLRRLPDVDGPTTAELAAAAEAIMGPAAWERFAGQPDLDFAYSLEGVARFRVNAFRQRGSLSLVLRVIKHEVPTLEQLGLPPVVGTIAGHHRGLVLATGPTGSGKSSTLAAILGEVNRTREAHVITIEDPIEVLHDDGKAIVNQREIGADAADFPSALRAALRADPDVILVGEMRDAETVEVALAAAETGHLVLSSLHTLDAAETVNRIVGFFPPHQATQIRQSLAGTLIATVCQRLVARRGGGRVAGVEIMITNERVRKWILSPETADVQEIIASSEFDGSQTFETSLIRHFAVGAVDLDDALAASTNAHSLRVKLRERGYLDSRRSAPTRGATAKPPVTDDSRK